MTRCLLSGLVVLVVVPVGVLRAEDKDVVGFWRTLTREKGVPGWVKTGLIQVELRDGKLTLEEVKFAVTGRTVGPKSLFAAKTSGVTWTFRGDYGGSGVGEMRMKRSEPDVYEGAGHFGKMSFPLRLERVPEKELAREYRAVIDELEGEILISEGLIPVFRDKLGDERARAAIDDLRTRLGLRSRATTIDRLMGIFRLGDLVNEQKRLAELNGKLKQARSALSRVEKLEGK